MEERFGGPVWHASGSTYKGGLSGAKTVARAGLNGVGDKDLGQWEYVGEQPHIWHVIRRITDAEREEFNVPEPFDIRGTPEERIRIGRVYVEAPHLVGRF